MAPDAGCSRSRPLAATTPRARAARAPISATATRSRLSKMKRDTRGKDHGAGPSQRQLRAAELVRHALVEILAREDLRDPDLQGVSITIGEVRASPDLRHMTAFVSSLAGGEGKRVAEGLTRGAGFLRGKLGRMIDL